MLVGIVRYDIGHMYLADVENRSQRNFSSEPAGQSQYFHRPVDTELQAVLNAKAFLTIRGSNTAATVDTTVANGTKLNIRTSASAAFTQITVTSSATAAKTQLVTDLNAGFVAAGLGLVARISGTNQITIDTTALGSSAYVEISASSPSTAAFHTVVGLTAAATSPLTVQALRNATYVGVTSLAGQTGAAASVTAPVNGIQTVTGLTGMTAASVGHGLTLSGSSSTFNTGTFVITAFISATSVQIANPAGVLDAGAGITWTEYTSVGINVASATITGLSTFSLMLAAPQAALVSAIQNIIAPTLVETGRVLLSFAFGDLFKMRSASFQPGGTRAGLPAGNACAIVANDGSTVFTL